jgi:NAD-dependent oxidoreductase involved in siderophore biosynthesis
MEKEYHEPLIELLVSFQNTLDPDRHAVVLHSIRRLLMGAPSSLQAWESVHGPASGSN